MNKRLKIIIFLSTLLLNWFLLCMPLRAADDQEFSQAEKALRLKEIEKSLDSLKRWQGQFKSKQKSFQTKASRLQFRNSTEARQFKELAEEAKENAMVLQDQIDVLISQKDFLLTKN